MILPGGWGVAFCKFQVPYGCDIVIQWTYIRIKCGDLDKKKFRIVQNIQINFSTTLFGIYLPPLPPPPTNSQIATMKKFDWKSWI